jgi:hypothetical protein
MTIDEPIDEPTEGPQDPNFEEGIIRVPDSEQPQPGIVRPCPVNTPPRPADEEEPQWDPS